MRKIKEHLKENLIGHLIVFALSIIGSIIMYSIRINHENNLYLKQKIESADESYINYRINELAKKQKEDMEAVAKKQKEDKDDILKEVIDVKINSEKQTNMIIEVIKVGKTKQKN